MMRKMATKASSAAGWEALKPSSPTQAWKGNLGFSPDKLHVMPDAQPVEPANLPSFGQSDFVQSPRSLQSFRVTISLDQRYNIVPSRPPCSHQLEVYASQKRAEEAKKGLKESRSFMCVVIT